jgi:hypothetical protein
MLVSDKNNEVFYCWNNRPPLPSCLLLSSVYMTGKYTLRSRRTKHVVLVYSCGQSYLVLLISFLKYPILNTLFQNFIFTQKFASHKWNRKRITVRHWTLSRNRWIQFTPYSHPVHLRPTLELFLSLRLNLSSDLFPSGFTTEIFHYVCTFPICKRRHKEGQDVYNYFHYPKHNDIFLSINNNNTRQFWHLQGLLDNLNFNNFYSHKCISSASQTIWKYKIDHYFLTSIVRYYHSVTSCIHTKSVWNKHKRQKVYDEISVERKMREELLFMGQRRMWTKRSGSC